MKRGGHEDGKRRGGMSRRTECEALREGRVKKKRKKQKK